jgi:hypothetical protein
MPKHLLTNSNSNDLNINYNLLLGSASADNIARLWYFNLHSTTQNSNQNSNFSPSTLTNNNCKQQTTSFCVQEYCGHAGSVNSIRFHPRFFTDATNVILTAWGDCTADKWQSVLSA